MSKLWNKLKVNKARLKKHFGILAFIGFSVMTSSEMVAYADIQSSVTGAEDPILDMAKTIGKFLFFVVLIIGAVAHFLGADLSRKAKSWWLGGIIATALIWNAKDIRDFVIGLF